MGDFASVFDEAGDSAEQAAADRAMAVAKQASTGIAGFLFQAESEDDFGHRIALAEDELTQAAHTAGISVHALVAEHTRSFDLLMEAKRSTAAKPTSDEDHKVLDDAWNKSFQDLKDAGVEHDADHPAAKAYRDASDAVNHSNRSRDFGIATGEIKTSAQRPGTCPTCAGARAIPAQGHESYHEVSNGQVRCPECAGHGVVQPKGDQDSDDRNADERYGETRYDDYYGTGGDAGDQQDRWYRDAAKHVASLRTALEEGQDPLEWLEQEGAGEGQAEKPSEAGIEALQGGKAEASARPFDRTAGHYDRENLTPGEHYTSDSYTGGREPHIDETGPHPRVHTFGTTSQAYDMSQYDDRIKDGDILHVPSEGVTGFLNEAWPIALHHNGDPGQFHGIAKGEDPQDIFGGGPKGQEYGLKDYSESLAKAKAVHEGSAKTAARQDFGPHIAPDHPDWAPHDKDTTFGLGEEITNCPHCGSRTDFEEEPGGGTKGGLATKNTCRGCGFRFKGDWDDFDEDEARSDREDAEYQAGQNGKHAAVVPPF